jgi:hypothetical protein
MHHFHSNSSVTINAVTQETGVIKGEIYTAQVGDQSNGSINIEVTFLNNDTGSPVHHQHHSVSEADMTTFEGTVTLEGTDTTAKFQELCARYALAQADGMWGLTAADWTLEAH